MKHLPYEISKKLVEKAAELGAITVLEKIITKQDENW